MGAEAQNDINVMELLLKISENVSAIKTDMANFKETYKSEKDSLTSMINDVRSDAKMDLASTKSTFQMEIDAIKKVQERQEKDIQSLQGTDDKKDAKKWRVVTAFILTAIGGFLVAHLPAFFRLVLNN